MNDLAGVTLTSVSNNCYHLTEAVSQGAQGVIYSESSRKYLIKILHEQSENAQTALENKLRALYAIDFPVRFIKPLDIIKFNHGKYFYVGYVMQRVKGHVSLNKLLIPDQGINFGEWYNTKAGGLKRRLYLGHQIAQSFALLHSHNMAYCDISGNNILVASNPKVNSVCMIDIDNVYTPGSVGSNILGTIRYIAPEIIDKKLQPDIVTDDYSLAVILFELLRCGHPYIGDFVRDGSPEIEIAAYRGEFPYVDDPEDTKNVSHDILPEKDIFNKTLKRLFRKTFVDGRTNRMARAAAKEFSVACLEASNALVHCENCRGWYYPFKEYREAHGYSCPWCSEESQKLINAIKAWIKFGELYPRFKDGTPDIPQRVKYNKTFILQQGNNFITNDYVRRILTEKDYVPAGAMNEVEGNIKINFVVSYDDWQQTCEMISMSDSPIQLQRKGAKLINIENGQRCRLEDGDAMYFEPPQGKITYQDITSGNAAARTRRLAIFKISK